MYRLVFPLQDYTHWQGKICLKSLDDDTEALAKQGEALNATDNTDLLWMNDFQVHDTTKILKENAEREPKKWISPMW